MGVGEFIVSAIPFFTSLVEAISKTDLSKIGASALSKDESINRIIDAYQHEELVLVLGAGVSVPYNLPDWKSLLEGLLLTSITKESDTQAATVDPNFLMILAGDTVDDHDKSVTAKLFNRVFDVSPLIAARYLRNEYNRRPSGKGQIRSGENHNFENQVQSLLYASLKKEEDSKLFDSGLMKEIRQICIAAGKRPNLDSIITYNFDDVLETCLSRLAIDIPYKVIYDVGMQPEPDKLSIYHVHGYLPRDGKLEQKHRLIFSEEVYHKQYADIYSWSNIVQINKFREKTCLFIGVSLTDPNMRRLLDIAQEQRGERSIQHFIFKKREKATDVLKKITTIIQKDEKLKSKLYEQKEKLPIIINTLIRLRQDFEEKDAYSFGVATIWINDFPEIDDIVRRVRRMERYQTDKK